MIDGGIDSCTLRRMSLLHSISYLPLKGTAGFGLATTSPSSFFSSSIWNLLRAGASFSARVIINSRAQTPPETLSRPPPQCRLLQRRLLGGRLGTPHSYFTTRNAVLKPGSSFNVSHMWQWLLCHQHPLRLYVLIMFVNQSHSIHPPAGNASALSNNQSRYAST